MIVKTDCETDGALHSTGVDSEADKSYYQTPTDKKRWNQATKALVASH